MLILECARKVADMQVRINISLAQQTMNDGAAGTDSIVKMLPWIGLAIVAVFVLTVLVLILRSWMISDKTSKKIDLATELHKMRKSMTDEEYQHVRGIMLEKMKGTSVSSQPVNGE